MSKILKYSIGLILSLLTVANIYIFVSGIKISSSMNKFDSETTKLHSENQELENKLYDLNSLQYAAKIASSLKFDKKIEPLYLDNLHYALNSK